MSNVWMQSRNGAAIDLLEPMVEAVNFREIADSLADINRYAGATKPAISVAYHSLMVFELSEPDIQPYALLHDAHEYVINDITTPTALALAYLGAEKSVSHLGQVIGDKPAKEVGYWIVREAVKELKARHDAVIWAAACLAPPTAEQERRIKIADIRAMATERRDFMGPSPQPWGDEFENAAPAPFKYTATTYGKSAQKVADRLYEVMCDHIPSLQGRLENAA